MRRERGGVALAGSVEVPAGTVPARRDATLRRLGNRAAVRVTVELLRLLAISYLRSPNDEMSCKYCSRFVRCR